MSMDTAAFFDVDGTIVRSNIVHYYVYFATRGFSRFNKYAWMAGFVAGKGLFYAVLDTISRSAFNRVFYRNYRNIPAADVKNYSEALFREFILPRIFPGAVERVKIHRERGERVILVTGSIDSVMAPLRDYIGADDLISVSLEEKDGAFTGNLTGSPVGDEEKARRIREFAALKSISLGASFAYGDSAADIPMLLSVGNPVAVNPGGKLKKIAREKGWKIERWTLNR